MVKIYTFTTYSRRLKVEKTNTRTLPYYTNCATNKSTGNVKQCSLLEPCAVKVARTVLRGGGYGDILSLPDTR